MNQIPPRGRRLLVALLAASTSMPVIAGESGGDGLPGTTEGLTASASIRSRVEAIDGQFRPGLNDEDVFVSFRTIVTAEYDFGPVRLGGELRDARGYAQNRGTSVGKSDVNALEPQQFYGALDLENVLSAGDVVSLIGGRTTLNIGSGRIIGESGFSNAVDSFTGGQLRWAAPNGDKFIGLYVLPSKRKPTDYESLRANEVAFDPVDDDKALYGAHFTRGDLFSGVSGEIYAFGYEEDGSARERDLATFGARLVRKGKAGVVDFDVEAIRQTGEIRDVAGVDPDIDVDAVFAHAEVGYTLAGAGKTRLSLFGDYGTGDDKGTSDVETFDKLYGKTSSDFGPTGLYGALSRSNIVAVGVGVGGKIGKATSYEVTGRGAWLESATDKFAKTGVVDKTGKSGTYAGTQFTAKAYHWLVPDRYRLEAGGAYLAKGEFLRDAPNAPDNGDTKYGYVAVTASF